MKKIFTLFIFLLLAFSYTKAQEIVVSEMENVGGGTTANEWVELLVIKDNISLVGYVIRDNETDPPHGWQGGVKFKNIPLWQNVRSGTIIVIHCRGYSADTEKDDGYLELGANDDNVFDRYMTAGNPNEWNIKALSLNGTHEMIQILDAAGNHVHLLGLMNTPSDVYDAIIGPKSCYTHNVSTGSVSVVPGADISTYSGGFSDAQTAFNVNSTLGLPNNVPGRTDINQLFWRKLREPSENPSTILTATPNIDNVSITWNSSSLDNDPVQGYMLVRINKNDIGTAENPKDSYDYQIGDKIGSAEVIAFIPGLSTKQYTDLKALDCGTEYIYRLYAYRFGHDDNGLGLGDEKSAHGRAFLNDKFTESNITTKSAIVKPILSTPNNELTFCDNQIIKIQSDAVSNPSLKFEWFKNNVLVSSENDNFLLVKQSGSYRLKISDVNTGCESSSDNIILNFIESPKSYILDIDRSFTFPADTTIILCKNEQLKLRGVILPASSDSKYNWIKDGVTYKSDVSEIIPDSDGKYRFIASTAGKCPDTSVTINIKIVNNDFTLSPTSLNFDADLSPQQNLTITNNSDNDIIINQSDLAISSGQGFSIVNPQFPYTIQAKKSITIFIKFNIAGYGTKTGNVTVSLKCVNPQTVDLKGQRVNIGATRLDALPTAENFGKIANGCQALPDTLIKLFSTGPEKVLIRKPFFKNSFFALKNSFSPDTTLSSNDSMSVYFNMTVPSAGIYSDTLYVPYFIDSKPDAITDTIRIPMNAILYTPSIGFDYDKIDVSSLTACSSTLDSFLIIENKNAYDISISNDPAGLTIKNKPIMIKANSKDTVFFHANFTNKNPVIVQFDYSPCSLKSPDFTIIPPQNSLLVNLVPDTLNMGLINNCLNPGNMSITLNIHVSGSGASIGEVKYIGTGFQSELTNGKQLFDGDNDFNVTLHSVSPKIYRDSIVFTILPCNERKVVYMNAERKIPSDPVYVKDSVDFGTDGINIFGRDTIKVINTDNTFDLVIDSIPNLDPFLIENYSQSDFPIRAKAGDTIKLAVAYPRTQEGSPVINSKIFTSSPCNTTKNILLKGNAVDNTTYQVALGIEDNSNALLFKDYTMSVNLKRIGNWLWRQARIEYFAIYLSYDPSRMYIRKIDSGRAIYGLTNNFKMYEDVLGKIKVASNITDSTVINDGQWLKLTYVPLLGSGLDTRVTVDSITFRAKRGINVEQDTGFVYITGNCDLRGRFARINEPVGLNFVNGNVVSGSADIEFSVATEDNTVIEVYNSQGSKIENIIDRSLAPGNYNATVNLKEYPDGLYFITMKSGTAQRLVKFIVMK